MNMSSLLSRYSIRMGFFRFVAPFLFSAIALVGILGPTTAYACANVDVVVHSDQSAQYPYALVMYTGSDGSTKSSNCTYVSPYQWQDMGVTAAVGNVMYINFYKSDPNGSTIGQCKAWDQELSYTIPASATSSAVYGTCWFNPVNGIWSGCQSTSSTIPVGQWGPVSQYS